MGVSERVSKLLAELQALEVAQEEELEEIDEQIREKLYSSARKVMLRIEHDSETLQRIDLAPIQLAVIKLAYDVNLFETIAKSRSSSTLDELAFSTQVNPELLSRILKFSAAHGMIDEVAEDEYGPNKMTRSFAMPGFRGAVISHRATTMVSAHVMPEFLASTNYSSPNDPRNCSLQEGLGSGDTFFEFLENNPLVGESFNEYMSAVTFSQKKLGAMFDWENLWGKDTTHDTPLFVDVGGGNGHQCKSLCDSTEGLASGRIILQDQPVVVENVTSDKFEVMAHDFFQEQPIKGAKAYYFRTILHDWPDDDCRTILGHIRDAMGPDSVILIDERVIANTQAHWIAMNMDLNMMLLLAAKERSERQWTELMRSAGLKIRNINTYSNAGASIIEVVKDDQSNELMTNGVETNGVYTNGVETNGVQTDSFETNGVDTNGVQMNGIETNGV